MNNVIRTVKDHKLIIAQQKFETDCQISKNESKKVFELFNQLLEVKMAVIE